MTFVFNGQIKRSHSQFACQCTIKNVVMTKIGTTDFKKVTLTCKRYSCHEKGDNDIKKGMEAKK